MNYGHNPGRAAQMTGPTELSLVGAPGKAAIAWPVDAEQFRLVPQLAGTHAVEQATDELVRKI